ncbi:ubiquitin carboxyl-terminal hydrolase 26-like isoform X3 [Onychostoma macrolepis]|uniref:ubiquitin carboxyl-terminal hydrolase 26-like isoform X3 n=1 Tax=Onychostoma macrolepis TaxID=369639 RepID=UPI00272D248D|nr:ubiquitin carboxyl-terminal hydrolase 26-like isoform X3 [Onychostoma macrolepis]
MLDFYLNFLPTKNLVRAVHQSDEKMDKNPKKEKKKRVKLALCSSVDVMDSSSAAPEDRDKPPSSSSSSSSSSGKRRFKGLRRFFCRMLSFCGVSSSSEQDKTSSIQTQKTSDDSSAVGRSSEELQEVDLLTADQKKEAVGAVVPPDSSSSADVRSSEQTASELQTEIQETEPVTVVEGTKPPSLSVDGPSSADRVSAQETKPFTDAALSFESIDVERLVELLASFGVQWHDLSKDSLKELLKSLEEQEEASEEKSAEEDDADQAALGLPNLGNTCYMNSVIQCLLSVSPFREDLLSQQENHTDSATLLRALTDLHMSRMDSSDSDLKETHLAKVKSYIESHFPVFKGRCQQDAHEFFMACLSRLKEESMSLRSSHPSYTCPVSSMEFKLRSERTCNSCGLMKSFTEESNCLSLVIGPHASLTDSLQQYMNASFIDCVCSLCGGPQASETLKFLSLPRVLVLLVQRFDFTSSMIKLKNRLEIPEELTLSCVKGRSSSRHQLTVQTLCCCVSCGKPFVFLDTTSVRSVSAGRTDGCGAATRLSEEAAGARCPRTPGTTDTCCFMSRAEQRLVRNR